MRSANWIPTAGGLVVALALAIPAGLGDWSAPAIYGIVFLSIITWAVLLALTDRSRGSSPRR